MGGACAALIAIVPAHAGSEAIGQVYWVNGSCAVTGQPVSVTMNSGPAGVRLSLKRGKVTARRQNCGVVAGAYVIASGSGSGSISYTVSYSNGQSSNHTANFGR